MTSKLLLLVTALLLVWLLIRRRNARRDSTPALPVAETTKIPTAYHAVSIRFSANACNAAKALAGHRFLSNAAPTLPLPECNASECNCRFTHHDDRRTGKDRRSPFNPATRPLGTGRYEQERRRGEDRRADPDDRKLL